MPPSPLSRQHREQLRIQLACLRKCPRCVGKILRVETAYAPFCHLREHCEQLRIQLAFLRKCPRCVGETLRAEIAYTPLCCCRQSPKQNTHSFTPANTCRSIRYVGKFARTYRVYPGCSHCVLQELHWHHRIFLQPISTWPCAGCTFAPATAETAWRTNRRTSNSANEGNTNGPCFVTFVCVPFEPKYC